VEPVPMAAAPIATPVGDVVRKTVKCALPLSPALLSHRNVVRSVDDKCPLSNSHHVVSDEGGVYSVTLYPRDSDTDTDTSAVEGARQFRLQILERNKNGPSEQPAFVVWSRWISLGDNNDDSKQSSHGGSIQHYGTLKEAKISFINHSRNKVLEDDCDLHDKLRDRSCENKSSGT